MPRFSDAWVVDRVLFDYVAGGSCACCGISHFLPNGTADMIAAVSDLDTDQQTHEVAAWNESNNPWPPELRDQVWADRVRLRQRLKRKTAGYREFWEEHGTAFRQWLLLPSSEPNDTKVDDDKNNDEDSAIAASAAKLRRLLQLSRSDVMEIMQTEYQIHSAYGVVLCAVIEQVANFGLTQYPTDAPDNDPLEVAWEQDLCLDRRAGLTLQGLYKDHDPDAQRASLEQLANRIESLGSPKLLERRRRRQQQQEQPDNSDSEEEEADGPVETAAAQTSFLSDRRIIRLVLARYWADQLQKRFLSEMAEEST